MVSDLNQKPHKFLLLLLLFYRDRFPSTLYYMHWIFFFCPDKTYPDRKAGAKEGIYEVSDLSLTPYLVPQECGMRMDTEWLEVTRHTGLDNSRPDSSNQTLRIEKTDRKFAFSCLPYTASEIENAFNNLGGYTSGGKTDIIHYRQYSCEDGMMMYASHRPDLVVLDLGLPDQDGMTFLKRLRKDSLTPVIVLSARSDEKDKVEALDMGANDYVTKPFGSNEFLARIRSTLRMTTHRMQNGMFPGGKFKASGLTIDYDARRVFLHKKEVKLTQTEYNIIAALSEHAGKVMTYSAIIKEIWGYNDEGSIKKLQVNMVNIRKKLGARPGEKNYIVNELGVGYRMCEADEETL